MKFYILSLFFILCLPFSARSEDDQILKNDVRPQDIQAVSPDNFAKSLAVLDYYGVGPESDPGPDLSSLQKTQSLATVRKLLKYFDPNQIFSRLSSISNNVVSIFKDLDTKQVGDFTLELSQQAEDQESGSIFKSHEYDLSLPLKGLRIALDPGHMGGQEWDVRTGKYVSDQQGRIVSEGVINLQTCLLLKEELEKLGAIVFVTHEGLTPVTTINYQTYDMKPFALNELRDNVHAPWFLKLVAQHSAGPELFRAFDESEDRKKLFSDNYRDDYFIRRADLWARAEVINNFNPDLVLIIHYDTADSENSTGVNPQAPKQTKAFVVGGYEVNELGSVAQRKYFAKHLLDQRSWDLSMRLSRSIVQKMHKQLGLSLAINADTTSYPIEPGILARNLVIPRMLNAPAISYLECLFYNNPEEFKMLLNANHPMQIDGKNIPYSDRIVQVVQAIRDGVIEFAAAN